VNKACKAGSTVFISNKPCLRVVPVVVFPVLELLIRHHVCYNRRSQ
jgi:hypothetical protein